MPEPLVDTVGYWPIRDYVPCPTCEAPAERRCYREATNYSGEHIGWRTWANRDQPHQARVRRFQTVVRHLEGY